MALSLYFAVATLFYHKVQNGKEPDRVVPGITPLGLPHPSVRFSRNRRVRKERCYEYPMTRTWACCLTDFVGRGDSQALRDSSDGASGDSASVSGAENPSTVQKIILESDVVKILGLKPKKTREI